MSSPLPSQPVSFGPVLVIGGCGFLGYHIVKALLQDPDGMGPIFVASRNPNTNLQSTVTYRTVNISDAEALRQLMEEIKPQIIFHTASPRPINHGLQPVEFKDTNVHGTINVIKCGVDIGSVKSFVYTSSVNVLVGSPHVDVTEDGPLWQPDSNAIVYWRTKAEAERIVLKANRQEFPTVSLRLPLIVGEREHAFVPAQLDAYNKHRTGIQLGNNANLIDTVSTENAAMAHLIAAKALLNPQTAPGKVDGEAFNITDGKPVPFWTLSRMIWRAAGDTTEPGDVTIIPSWIAMGAASAVELCYKLFSLGSKKPDFNKHLVTFCTTQFTYNISKARRDLGYNPVAKTEEVLQRAVAWELQKRAEERETSM